MELSQEHVKEIAEKWSETIIRFEFSLGCTKQELRPMINHVSDDILRALLGATDNSTVYMPPYKTRLENRILAALMHDASSVLGYLRFWQNTEVGEA